MNETEVIELKEEIGKLKTEIAVLKVILTQMEKLVEEVRDNHKKEMQDLVDTLKSDAMYRKRQASERQWKIAFWVATTALGFVIAYLQSVR